MAVKKCPFHAEAIPDTTAQGKHCGEFPAAASLGPRLAEEKMPWYFRKPFIVLAVGCVGPLALPLIWWRPHTTRAWKLGLTVGILGLSWFLFQATLESLHTLKEYYQLREGL